LYEIDKQLIFLRLIPHKLMGNLLISVGMDGDTCQDNPKKLFSPILYVKNT